MTGRSWNEPDELELARLTVMVLSGAESSHCNSTTTGLDR